jgi:hypothetical protein
MRIKVVLKQLNEGKHYIRVLQRRNRYVIAFLSHRRARRDLTCVFTKLPESALVATRSITRDNSHSRASA